jgi:cytosine/creatinine deaminase
MLIDQEGLVECSILVESEKIVQVTLYDCLPPTSSCSFALNTVDCQGSIVVPCFADAHTHLVKTQTVPRNRNFSGTMYEAIEAEASDQPRWVDKDNVVRLNDFAAKCALHHGTRAIRTHLDGCSSEDPNVRQSVYEAFDTIRDKYSKDLIVQGVANLWLPLWLEPVLAKSHADKAALHVNVVLGAYVGNTSTIPHEETVKGMEALFAHAQRLSLDCDLHIDESNDPRCCALLALCESLSTARKAGYKGRVVLGHCCSLSLQDEPTKQYICKQLAALDGYVVSNPLTNLGLQDRKGSKPPHSLEIPSDIARTPQWRGLTLLQELRQAGVTVACASDNVRDHWHPYGDFDMLSVWAQGQAMGHLDTAPSEGYWADICTTAPAKAMGLSSSLLAPGEPADLVLFPSARRASELFARPQTDRIVLRRGRVQTTLLPEFSELDDIIAVKTERLPSESLNAQSAT